MKLTDNAQLGMIVDSAPIGICILDSKTLVAEMLNEKFLEIAGKPKDAIIGKWYWEPFAEAQEFYEHALLGVVTSKKPFYADEVKLMLIRNGKQEWIHVTFVYAPVLDDQGEVSKVAVWVLENTTQVREREKLEAARSILESKLNAQAANDNLEQILNMIPASVVVIRGDDLIVEMINTSNLDYWQKTKQEVIGRPFLDILPDLAGQPFAGQLRRVIATGEVIDVKESPVLFTMADGTVRETYVDYTYQPLSDLEGNRNGVLVMSFEITDRVVSKRLLQQYADELTLINSQLSVANNSLAKSEARFKFLIQEAPIAIGILHGRDLIVESANAKLLEVWGKDASVIGVPLPVALPEIKDQPFQGILEKVFDTGEAFYANEIRALLEHDGQLKELFFNLVYQPVKDGSGAVADILVVAADVSQQVNSRKAVEQSEAHFRQLADLVPAKISNALPSGEVTFFNQKWLDFAGMDFEDLRDFGYHRMMHPEEIAPFQAGLAAAAESGIPYISELRFRDTSGRYIWHLNIASPIVDENGKITMWVGSTTDIQALKEEEQRKNDFIGMVSHELKTPLTSLAGYLQILNTKLAKSDDQMAKRSLEQSLKKTAKMTGIINGFLNVTRLESGQMPINLTSFDISSIFREVEAETGHDNATHQVSYDPFPAKVVADHDKIVQVLSNLVSNAMKYSKPGTSVRVSGKVVDDQVVIAVADEGMGISKLDLPQVFDRFYRVETGGNISGFGIGLYLCAEIIKRHKGRIWAESEVGKGSVFYFSLPLA